ncbi:MAG: nitrous oxide reductase family maturation protein NosD [Bacteroidetes bacterium]|nr:nitrous oxide reductase family maturation protein NosD [Bacteroidota bacterium]
MNSSRVITGALFTFLLTSLICPARAHTIKVGPQQAISSITQALTMASNGDTVEVNGGTYKEGNIIISKSIALIGKSRPVLDGQFRFEILSVKANGVLVSGFQIQHCGQGTLDDPGAIKVYDASQVRIENNDLVDNFFGIYLQYSHHSVIKNNRISAKQTIENQSGNGIHCWKSDNLQITGNHISGHRDGIYFEFVTESVIWRNISENNLRYGLHFMFSGSDAYFSNLFRRNGAGVAVMFTNKVTMMNNTFTENWGDAAYGLLLKEISDCTMIGNRFLKNTTGIMLDGSNRVYMEKNLLKGNGWGMRLQANCVDDTIVRNNFIGNTFDVSTNGSLTLNKFDHNYWDKYEGYDLNKDQIGDVPYHPLSLYSVVAERNPPAMLLYRSFIISLLDKSEKMMPSLTPANFVDPHPLLKPLPL